MNQWNIDIGVQWATKQEMFSAVTEVFVCLMMASAIVVVLLTVFGPLKVLLVLVTLLVAAHAPFEADVQG